MEAIFDFFANISFEGIISSVGWAGVVVFVLQLLLRIIPTDEKYDPIRYILRRLIDWIPDVKRGGGRHPTFDELDRLAEDGKKYNQKHFGRSPKDRYKQ